MRDVLNRPSQESSPIQPLITTVIPTYCRPRFLSRAIRSVLSQTYPHFRVCVYADESAEETMSLLSEFAREDSRVQYYRHPVRIGLEKNFRYGMTHVETPFFSFLGDDDILFPDFYEKALAGFEKYSEAAVSICNTVFVDSQGNPTFEPLADWEPGLHLPPQGMLAMLRKYHPQINSILIRSQAAAEVGIDVEVGTAFDLDFELRLAGTYPIVVTLEPAALWVVHEACASLTASVIAKWSGWPRMIDNIKRDVRIPAEARSVAVRILERKALSGLFHDHVLPASIRKDWNEVDTVSSVLRDYFRLRSHAFAVRAFGGLNRYLPAVHRFTASWDQRVKSRHRKVEASLRQKWPDSARLLKV